MLIRELTDEQYLTVKLMGFGISRNPEYYWYVSLSEVNDIVARSVVELAGKPFIPCSFHNPSDSETNGWRTVLVYPDGHTSFRLIDQPSILENISALVQHRAKIEKIFSNNDITFKRTSVYLKLDYFPTS